MHIPRPLSPLAGRYRDNGPGNQDHYHVIGPPVLDTFSLQFGA